MEWKRSITIPLDYLREPTDDVACGTARCCLYLPETRNGEELLWSSNANTAGMDEMKENEYISYFE